TPFDLRRFGGGRLRGSDRAGAAEPREREQKRRFESLASRPCAPIDPEGGPALAQEDAGGEPLRQSAGGLLGIRTARGRRGDERPQAFRRLAPAGGSRHRKE